MSGRPPHLWLAVVAAACLLSPPAATAQPAQPDQPARTRAIMPLKDIRVGMKGYGLTVFHGATVEPFAVEIVSVMRDFAPQRGVIWIRCPDERLLKTGPVSGMSGSPIYLWDENEEQAVGKGGKLIGAFAFGWSWTKDCYAGVQPIELMRATGQRIDEQASKESIRSAKLPVPGASLVDLIHAGRSLGWSEQALWEARLYAKLLGVKEEQLDAKRDVALPRGPADWQGQPMRMMLPMAVGSKDMADALTPLLAPMGIAPLQSPIGVKAGNPPPGVDPETVKLEPGGVLAIPLAFGDADLSATGTITDVLPDGTVIGFGHPMFGQGDVLMPLASGYVHFVVPRMSSAFKLGGGMKIKGAILRDDASAVAGKPGVEFHTAPVTVTVNFDGAKTTYRYRVLHHQRLTPTIAASVIAQSLTADRNLSDTSTVVVKGAAKFEGGHVLELNNFIAPATQPTQVLAQLLPALASMIQNQHEPFLMESLDVELEVRPQVESVEIAGVRVERSDVAPGEKLELLVSLIDHHGAASSQKMTLRIPPTLADGRYSITVGDASAYANMLVRARPHLMLTSEKGDVYDTMKLLTAIPRDGLFAVLQLPESGLAIGRKELPQLPSSRQALIAASQNTLASRFAELRYTSVRLGKSVSGNVSFEIDVQHGEEAPDR